VDDGRELPEIAPDHEAAFGPGGRCQDEGEGSRAGLVHDHGIEGSLELAGQKSSVKCRSHHARPREEPAPNPRHDTLAEPDLLLEDLAVLRQDALELRVVIILCPRGRLAHSAARPEAEEELRHGGQLLFGPTGAFERVAHQPLGRELRIDVRPIGALQRSGADWADAENVSRRQLTLDVQPIRDGREQVIDGAVGGPQNQDRPISVVERLRQRGERARLPAAWRTPEEAELATEQTACGPGLTLVEVGNDPAYGGNVTCVRIALLSFLGMKEEPGMSAPEVQVADDGVELLEQP
jgi:hypothetical protein